MKYENIGIIGAGTMGIGITVDFVIRGIKVVLIDVSQEILEKAKAEIIKELRFMPLLKKDTKFIDSEEAIKLITFSIDLQTVKDCDFIIENVTENRRIKEKIYIELDKICKPSTCFGVNTSCVSITEVGALTKRPHKVIGMHFMNPVILKSSIEVIKGYHTSEETISLTKELLRQVDKQGIFVNDLPGFVSNRVSHLFMNEAAFIVQDQVASPKQVDEIFKKCFGHKMGPLETADLIGLDTVVYSLDVLYESYQDSKYRCCPLLRKLVNAGLKGRKVGKGFYEYN